jgi:hypothetical protein
MNEHLATIRSEKRKQPTEEDLEDDLINSSCNNYEASFLDSTSKINNDSKANEEEEEEQQENLIEKSAKRFKQETSYVTINNELIDIVTLKLPQLKDQLKIRGVKIEGNKEKLFSKLREVSFIILCILYKYKNLI